jgi:two-component system response regulator NreC
MSSAASIGSARVRVFFIEDEVAVANLFALFLGRMPQFAYLGCAQTLESALSAVNGNAPELVFVDVNMPDGDGIEYLPKLRKAAPQARFVVCTSRDDPAFVERALRRERIDLIHKHDVSTAERFLKVWESMRTQEQFVSPRLARVGRSLQDSDSFVKKLSDRELMLLPLFGRNLADDEIGRIMGLSPSTIHAHRQHVMSKLDLHTAAALIVWCVANGFVERRDLLGRIPSADGSESDPQRVL